MKIEADFDFALMGAWALTTLACVSVFLWGAFGWSWWKPFDGPTDGRVAVMVMFHLFTLPAGPFISFTRSFK
jgi:hypothetical protein